MCISTNPDEQTSAKIVPAKEAGREQNTRACILTANATILNSQQIAGQALDEPESPSYG